MPVKSKFVALVGIGFVVAVTIGVSCHRKPEAVPGLLAKPIVSEAQLEELKTVLLGWPSLDPGPTDLPKRLGALKDLFMKCPSATRIHGLLSLALSDSAWCLIAGATYAAGTGESGKGALMTGVAGTDSWACPPMVPAWMLFAQSSDVASALSSAATCLEHTSRRVREVGHALFSLLSYQHREPDAWIGPGKPSGLESAGSPGPSRSTWVDLIERELISVNELVEKAVLAAERLRTQRSGREPFPRTIENLENLLIFHLRLPTAQYLRRPPSEDPSGSRARELVSSLPTSLSFDDLKLGTPITTMIVMPTEFSGK